MADPYLDLDSARWARARDDYRAGATAGEVCARYELSRSTFYARASAERWRRADQPSARTADAEPDDFDPTGPRRTAFEMADLAHRRLSHALERGRLREALGWARLAKEMRALASEEGEWSWRTQHRELLAATAAEAKVAAPMQAGTDGAAPAALSKTALEIADASDSSPGKTIAEAFEDKALCEGGLDSPDSFFESEAQLIEGEALGEDEGLDESIAEEWTASDWEEWAVLRAQLAEERPDLPWWTRPGEEAPPDEPP